MSSEAVLPGVQLLLLEDDPFDAELVERELHRALPHARVLHVVNQAELRTALYEADVSLVLSDNNLPGFDALGALQIVLGIRPGLPFIVVSGTVGEDRAVDMLRAGVTDYVLKDRLGRLGLVVQRALDENKQRLQAKRAEERAREVVERFRIMAERAPVGIFQLDANLRYVYVNARWGEITQLPVDEMIGRQWGMTLVPEWGRRMAAEAASALELADRVEFVRADGETRTVLMNARRLLGPQGGVVGWIASIADITEAVRAEAEAREANERFKVLAQRAPVGIFQVGADLRYTYVNPRWSELSGFAAEDVIGQEWGTLSVGEIGDRIRETAFTTGEVTIRFNQPGPDGGPRTLLMTSQASLGSQGGILGWVGTLIDLTSEVQATEALREANERFKVVAEQAPIGIFLADADDRYTYVNPRWTELTGVSAEATLGLRMGTVLPSPEARDGFTTLRQAEEGSTRFELRRADGSTRVLLVTSKALIGAGGHLTGRVGTVADITDQTRAQDALADARDRATEASRLKSHFLANMSHEIRTPMIGVIGMTDLLLETRLDVQQRDYAETLRSSGKALLTVINDILDFSKVEAGRLEIDQVDFDVERVVYDVVDLLAGTAQAKGLEIVAHVDDSIPALVTGDPGRVRQVLMNLIGNALKFTPSGDVVVRVRARQSSQADTMLEFQVSDNGDGLAPEQLSRIFEPFTQADTSTSRRYGGTGLGLAISRQLVELMGGTIEAASELGIGSTFTFTIKTRARDRRGPDHFSVDPVLSGLRVLVVDDSAAQTEVLAEYLHGWGVTVETVESGPAALDSLRGAAAGERFAIALVDQQMPVMDGWEVAAAIAADGELADTRVVVMTDLAAVAGTDRSSGLTVAGALSKPIHRDDLLETLRLALRRADDPSRRVVASPDLPANGGQAVGHLLLAEDNLINQKVTVAMLSSAGYRVDTVLNGSAAVAAAAAHPYDAILMDCQMPVLNGYEATAAIRSQEGPERHTPIIALTAAARNEDRERCLAEGMDEYLAKPVSKADLLSRVGRSLRP